MLAAFALSAALTGCGSDDPVRGIVVEKDHEAARWEPHRETVYRTQCDTRTVNKKTTTTCKQVASGTKTVNHYTPECWELELDTGWEGCIDEKVWNQLDVKDPYDSSKY